jgi:ubiquinone/menaquinone biosynthesis C-methylase UbiE
LYLDAELVNQLLTEHFTIVMNPQLTEIRDQQKQSWNKFSPGWKKWDDLTMSFLRPMGSAIIRAIQPAGNHTILDIASGTGEPGLSIAAMIPGGKVVLTDLAEDMLAIARENAAKKKITNIETITCDVCELPFADNSFDAVSCRFGFMFFPDMQLAANELFRVLKPGGRVATSVWDIPEKNFWVTATMGTINQMMELPPNPSGAPGMFRCCKPGLMKELFANAGFKDCNELPVSSLLNSGTFDTYWDMMTEIGAPIVAALSQADENMQKAIKSEVFALVTKRYAGRVAIEGNAIVISAQK